MLCVGLEWLVDSIVRVTGFALKVTVRGCWGLVSVGERGRRGAFSSTGGAAVELELSGVGWACD